MDLVTSPLIIACMLTFLSVTLHISRLRGKAVTEAITERPIDVKYFRERCGKRGAL